MIIYKYRTADLAKKILQNATIKVTAASEFNDPFELSPTIDPKSFTPAIVREMLLHDHIIQEFYIQEGGRLSFPQFLREYRKPANLSRRVQKFVSKAEQNAEVLRTGFAERFDRHHRLFCASKKPDSILMWSHYADEHKGCVVGFDSDRPPFSELKEWFVEVDYRDEKIPFTYDPRNKAWHKGMLAVTKTKHTGWAYEDEVRTIFPGDEGIVRIPETTIRKVIFGCRCPQAAQDEVLQIVRGARYAHVELLVAGLSRDLFKLELKPI
jgi:Zn ribbon nucleic-acid-binding protein